MPRLNTIVTKIIQFSSHFCLFRYLNHIRGASSSEKAGGYTESMACQRAIQEAFDGLFI